MKNAMYNRFHYKMALCKELLNSLIDDTFKSAREIVLDDDPRLSQIVEIHQQELLQFGDSPLVWAAMYLDEDQPWRSYDAFHFLVSHGEKTGINLAFLSDFFVKALVREPCLFADKMRAARHLRRIGIQIRREDLVDVCWDEDEKDRFAKALYRSVPKLIMTPSMRTFLQEQVYK
jgi:hypothetical protein